MEATYEIRGEPYFGHLRGRYSKDELKQINAHAKRIGKSGHGGMDGFLFRAFVDAAKSGSPMPIDVYDAATWMSITYLSEKSIALGGAPVDIHDFTNGKWTYDIDPNMKKL